VQLLESGIVTLSVYLIYYWSRFLLRGEADSAETFELFFDAVRGLYYEAAVWGGASATALAFSKAVEEALEPHLQTSTAAIKATSSFLSWAERWNPAILAYWHPKLERLARDPLIPRDLRASAAYQLVWTPQDITGIDGREIARFAYVEFHSLYNSLQLVCLLGRICDGSGPMIIEWLPDITRMIEHHVGGRIDTPLLDIEALEERALGLRILGPIIRTLIEAGQDSDAVMLAGLWMGVDRADIRTTRLITLIMSQSVGAIFATKGRIRHIANPRSITPLIQPLNEALRENLRNLDDITWQPEPHDPRHSRVPDSLQVPDLLSALQAYLPVREARDLIISNEAGALLAMPAIPIPLQGWLLYSLGHTLPLTVSLRNPKPDRSIRRALLWAEGSLYSEIERAEVNSILLRAGIAVDIPKRYTATEFQQKYNSGEYDLIWVASHGLYEPSAPHLSKLQVGVDEWVDTGLLRKPRESETRRLLVLNACEGGATFIGGGLLDSGLAASAASPSQAVIAHLWPIRAWPDAVGFAVVLSFLLVNEPDDCLPGFGRTFFEAYQQCLRILSEGPE
jgi:CHAT domain